MSDLFLFFIVGALLWFLAEFLAVRLQFEVKFNLFYGTRHGAWLVLGPLFYLYARSVLTREVSRKQALLHLLPFIIASVLIPLFAADFLSSGQVNYGMLSSFYPFSEDVSVLQYVYSSIYILQYLHLLVYLVMSFLMISRYRKKLKGHFSALSTDILWLKALNLLVLAVLILVSVFLGIFFATHSYNKDLDYLYTFPIALIVYVTGYSLAGVKWPVIFQGKNTLHYEKSSLKPDDAKTYVKKLQDYIEIGKPYLKNDLRLIELADMIKVPSHHLSQVINEYLQTTFFDYINRCRVNEAQLLIMLHPDATLLDIAFRAGFNNKTSFTNAFRKFAGQTPREYRLELLFPEKRQKKS